MEWWRESFVRKQGGSEEIWNQKDRDKKLCKEYIWWLLQNPSTNSWWIRWCKQEEVLKITNDDGKFRRFNARFTNKVSWHQFELKRYQAFYVYIVNIDFALIYDLDTLFIWRNFSADSQYKYNWILPGLDLAILDILRNWVKFSPRQNFFK